MLFNSLQFIVFFPTVAAVYYLLPHRYRWLILLVASSYFYMVFVPKYILVIFTLILVDYVLGICIENAESQRKKFYLVGSIFANLGILFIFKYFNFFNGIFAGFAELWHLNYPIGTLTLLLPLGLSFHVFQSLSYVIEVYRGRQKAEHDLRIYALYVMFFPQLVAGPIERPYHLLHQFKDIHLFDYGRTVSGLRIILWGFFKKLIIADTAAIGVNHIFNSAHQLDGLTLIAGAVLFSYQLYGDFSGYSDIAVGSARILGFDLINNFDRPYASRSISEFWRRWHISLSSWLRDYLYYPLVLGRKQITRARLYMSIMITFVLIGLWHGANWTYILMGALHGWYLVFGAASRPWRDKFIHLLKTFKLSILTSGFQVVATFALVSFGWVFFRAPTLNEAWYYISHLGSGLSQAYSLSYLKFIFSESSLGLTRVKLALLLFAIVALELVQYARAHNLLGKYFFQQPYWVRWGLQYALIFLILYFANSGAQPFIYFQF